MIPSLPPFRYAASRHIVAEQSVGDGLPGYVNNTAGDNLAKVVCRQLGYNNSAIMLPSNVTDGLVTSAVVLDVTYVNMV